MKSDELPLLKKGRISVKLFIDGMLAEHSIYCTLDSEKKATYCMTMKGFTTEESRNLRTMRAFTFGKLLATSE